MFEVSWDDPSKETVGQRKSRKESGHISRSSEQQSRALTSGDSTSTKLKNRPSILTLLNSNKKAPVPEKPFVKEAFHPSISVQGPVATKEPTSNLILDRYIVTEYPHSQELSTHSTSKEPTATFTSWASHSSSSSSSSPWSSTSDLARAGISSLGKEWRRSGRGSVFIQPLSPTSFVTRRTDVSVETRRAGDGDGVRGMGTGMGMGIGTGMGMGMGMEGEVSSTVIRIYADDGRRDEVREMYARLSTSFPSSPLSPPSPSLSSSPSRSSTSTTSTSNFTLHDPPIVSTSSTRSQSALRLPINTNTTRSSSKPRLVLIDPETAFRPRHVRHHKRSPVRRSSRSRSRSNNGHRRRKDRRSNASPNPSTSTHSNVRADANFKVNANGSPNLWKAPENWECSRGGGDKVADSSESESVPPLVPPKSAARLLKKSAVAVIADVGADVGAGL